jgi:NAD(P)-dependent dehydrogenase (short-subunit alcohol dehydrogenase family)
VTRRSGNDDVHVVALDLADLNSVATCADTITQRWPDVQVLVNNAGGMRSERSLTKQGFEMCFGANHLAHFLLTNRLLPVLKASGPSRVVNVASNAHLFTRRGIRFDDLQSEKAYRPFEVYGHSKLANILFTRELAHRTANDAVTATSCHPGSVDTEFGHDGDMTGFVGWLNGSALGRISKISVAKGAETQIHLALSNDVAGQSGGYYFKRKPKKTSRHGNDAAMAARLWTESERLLAEKGFSI